MNQTKTTYASTAWTSYPRKMPWSSVPAEGVIFSAGGLLSKTRSPLFQGNSQIRMCSCACDKYSPKPPEATAENPSGIQPDEILLFNDIRENGTTSDDEQLEL
jgi:hypothetical protein